MKSSCLALKEPQSQSGPACQRPPWWGKPLTEADHEALATSWITAQLADSAMLLRVDSLEGRELVGQKGKRDCEGIVIPYYWPGEPDHFNYRLRRDKPDWSTGKDGKPRLKRSTSRPRAVEIGFTSHPA